MVIMRESPLDLPNVATVRPVKYSLNFDIFSENTNLEKGLEKEILIEKWYTLNYYYQDII